MFGGKLIWTAPKHGGAFQWTDGHGATWDRVGSNVAAYEFYPYGEEYNTSTQDTEKYATYYRNQTSALDYARNRYYSSTLGRFMTPDPYRNSAGPGDPGSWNRYAYVGNDPVNFNDPGGADRYMVIGGLCRVSGTGGGEAGALRITQTIHRSKMLSKPLAH